MKIEGLVGHLRLHNADRPAGVLPGGIGITPFRSILLQAIRDGGLPYRVVLFYANRQRQDAAFLDELQTLATQDRNFTFVPTMTATEAPAEAWVGERGRIDSAMLKRHLADVTNAIYYVTGPPAMAGALRTMLLGEGVDEDDIRTEEFEGY